MVAKKVFKHVLCFFPDAHVQYVARKKQPLFCLMGRYQKNTYGLQKLHIGRFSRSVK